MTRSFRTLLLSVMLLAPPAFSMNESQYSLGLLGGHIALTGEVSEVDKQGGLGVGLLGGYAVRDDLFFNIQYYQASLGQVKHSAFTVGGDFYLMGPDAAAPYVSAGLGLLSNEVDFGRVGAQKAEISAEAFALYLGGGVEFELTSAMRFGLQARYNFAFEAKENVAGTPRTVVQDSYSVLARWIYVFGSPKPW